MSNDPLRFAFGIHVHQPIGNFDSVVAEHVDRAYLPFLTRIAESGLLPITLHVSGPLLEWLESHDSEYLDLIGRLAADGHLELLFSGLYEPVLVALPRADRLDQLARMRDRLAELFGVDATGIWLTERVWEPGLAADLAEAGAQYVLVDDRHFLVSGFPRERLHAPFRTEADGRSLAVLPIDERLRYLIPFRPAEETAAYLTDLRGRGCRLAIVADDGEKFGGWPGTRKWVFQDGWLDRFLETLEGLVERGEILPVTMAQAVDQVESGGLAYLPSAAYREMETWALPAEGSRRVSALEDELGEDRIQGSDGALIRGGHWRHFLVKYPEANRMHKKMLAVSALCRERGDPSDAREAISRAQCNDAYWHGVFGGLYLPHLRGAVWSWLARAEGLLRAGEAIAAERLDLDLDGHEEIWLHSAAFSAIVSPRRGGALEELTVFESGVNLLDVLTRRREAYHGARAEAAGDSHEASGDSAEAARAEEGGAAEAKTLSGTASIHDLERDAFTAVMPPFDRESRAAFVDRVLPPEAELEAYRSGALEPLLSWSNAPMDAELRSEEGAVVIVMRPSPSATDAPALEKVMRFETNGSLSVSYGWEPEGLPGDALFAPELSVAREVPIDLEPEAEVWRYPIVTVVRSERELEETQQGISLTPRWPLSAKRAFIRLRP